MPSIELIDWPALAASSLWILGLALMLAWASWRIYAGKNPGRAAYPADWVLTAGEIIFCLGLALTSSGLLERLIWLALAGLGLVTASLSFFKRNKTGNFPHGKS